MTAATPADFGDMLHALGRPAGPDVEPYRNFYCVDADSPTARRFEQLRLYWTKRGTINAGRDAVFAVTPEGIRLAIAWQSAQQAAAGLRRWQVVTAGGHVSAVTAKTRSAARYAAFLKISDIWPDGYGDWLTRSNPRVRLA